MKTQSILKSIFKNGVLMGILFCLYTTIMYLTNLDTTYLKYGQYLDILIILLPVFIIMLTIRNQNNLKKITIIERFTIAILVSAISYIIYDPFLDVYHHLINRSWFNSVLDLRREELISENLSQMQIDQVLMKMRSANISQSGLFRLSSLIPSVFILPCLIALVSMVFIKNRNEKKV